MAVRARTHTRARVRAADPARARQRLDETPRARVVEIQRSRLLVAAASAMDEHGYSHTTIMHITERARVSRRTFYDLFDDREDCLLAVLEHAVGLARREVLAAAEAAGTDWRGRVRAGLWAILSFLDREPVLARVCVVQTLRSGTRPLECREEVLAELARVLDEGRGESARGGACPPLTSEGLVGALSSILYGRLSRHEPEPLVGLFGELMEIIVLPYLGPAAARKEHTRATPVSGAPGKQAGILIGDGHGDRDPLADLPMRLTYRTARALEAVAGSPGVSNRVIGERSGISDQGQVSRLLARLRRLGLVANNGEGHARGEANAWTLTPTGQRVVRSIGAHADGSQTNSGGAA